MTADRPATEPRPCDICNNTGIDYLGRPCRLHGSYRAEVCKRFRHDEHCIDLHDPGPLETEDASWQP